MKLKMILKDMLKSWSYENDIEYMDFDLYALDAETKMVNSNLLNSNITDHHYSKEEFIVLIRKVFGY